MMPAFFPTSMGVFEIITGQFGESALWSTGLAGTPIAGTGLFKEPTAGQIITPNSRNTTGAEYNQTTPTFEFATGVFPGLREAAAVPDSGEYLILRQRVFIVGAVTKLYDGETWLAQLQEVLPTPAITAVIII